MSSSQTISQSAHAAANATSAAISQVQQGGNASAVAEATATAVAQAVATAIAQAAAKVTVQGEVDSSHGSWWMSYPVVVLHGMLSAGS